MNNNSISLHKTTHWRRLREIILELFRIESVNYSLYNLEKITCYRTIGSELQGETSEFFTSDGASCWVSDNHYDIYEIPKKGNENKLEGEYFILAHNTSYDYWLLVKFIYKINKNDSKIKNAIIDSSKFRPYGMYEIAANGRELSINKLKIGKDCNYGYPTPKGDFDSLGSRKKAYRTNNSKLFGEIIGISSNIKCIKGGDAVKIYKKKPKNNTKRKY